MALPVVLKRSSVSGKTPLTTELELGEIAVNTNDGDLFLKRDDGSETIRKYISILGGQVAPTDGYVLTYDDTNGWQPEAATGATPTKVDFTTTAASTTDFTTDYNTSSVEVYVSGIKLRDDEYTSTSGTVIVLDQAVEIDTWVSVISDGNEASPKGDGWTSANYADATGKITFVSDDGLGFITDDLRIAANLTDFYATSDQTDFTVNYTVNLVDVFIEGIKIDPDEYTASNGTSITLPAQDLGTWVQVVSSSGVGAVDGNGISSITRTSGEGLPGQTDEYTIDYTIIADDTFNIYNGVDGNGISSITRTTGEGLPGQTDEYTIDYTKIADGSFSIYNGTNGEGYTGGAYSDITGKITLTSDDFSDIVTDDLRIAPTLTEITATAGQTVFTANYNVNKVDVFIEGVKADPATYQASNGTSITLPAQDLNTWVQVVTSAGTAMSNGKGWTNGSYDSGTGIITFTSDDTGFAFATGDVRGSDGASGTNLEGLSDVGTFSTKVTNDILAWDGTDWGNYDASELGIAPLASPTFTGTVTLPSTTLGGTLLADDNKIEEVKCVTFEGDGSGGLLDLGNKATNWTFIPEDGQYQEVTLTGNTTMSITAPSGPCTMYLHIHQDATGGRTLTFPTGKWVGGTAKTVTSDASAHDLMMIHFYGGTNYVFDIMQDLG